MSDSQPVRRSGVPLLEVGIVGAALIGIAAFIWWGLEKSRETAMRGVAREELKSRGLMVREGDKPGETVIWRSIHHDSNLGTLQPIDDATFELLSVFTDAVQLHLDYRNVDRALLERLAMFKNLRELNVSVSQVTDSDLKLLSVFPKLERLVLSRTRIRGPGLAHLEKLSFLKSLSLSDTEITDDCIPYLLKLSPKARGVELTLKLGDTWLSEAGRRKLEDAGISIQLLPWGAHGLVNSDGSEPVEKPLMTLVEQMVYPDDLDQEIRYDSFRCSTIFADVRPSWLRLSGIRLLTAELEQLEHWEKLRFLDLTSLHIAGVTFYQHRRKYELPGLARMSELETLSLAGTGVGDYAIRPVSKCRNLKYLDLRMTDLRGAGLAVLSGLRGLEVLRLSHNMIEDDSLAALSGLTSLKRLELDSTDITDDGLQHLRSLKKLAELSISRTRVTKAAAQALQKQIGLRVLTTESEYDPPPMIQSGPALRPLIGIGNGAAGRAVNKRREAPYTEELIRRGFKLVERDDDARTGTLESTKPVSDDDLRFVSRLTGLQSAAISVAEVTPLRMWYLKRLPELDALTLTGPGISSELLTRVSELAQFRILTLRECDIDANGLLLIAASPTLKCIRLELGSGTELSEESLRQAGAGGIAIEVVSPRPARIDSDTAD